MVRDRDGGGGPGSPSGVEEMEDDDFEGPVRAKALLKDEEEFDEEGLAGLVKDTGMQVLPSTKKDPGRFGAAPHHHQTTPTQPQKSRLLLEEAVIIKTGDADTFSPAAYSSSLTIPSEKYESRTKKGEVIFRYKCKDSSSWEKGEKTPDSSHCSISALAPTKEFLEIEGGSYKYMLEKTRDVAHGLNYVLTDLGEEILASVAADQANTDTSTTFTDFYNRPSLKETSSEDSLFIGRIRGGDGNSGGGKPTATSTFFEGDLDASGGHMVALDLSSLEEDFAVFPGQACLAEGRNEMGTCLRLKKLHEPSPLPFSANAGSNKDSSKLSLLIACGPFTTTDTMNYQPLLVDLLNIIKQDAPDVCILIGPFLDSSQVTKHISKMAESFESFFSKLIERILTETKGVVDTKFLIVSSHKDVHGHFVYPTPPYFLDKYKDSKKRIQFLPDPATISINGFVVSITSTDVLMHLSKNEFANITSIRGDRMTRLTRHLLTQRSFYPLYPPEEGLPFDTEAYIKYGRMTSARPHILITPSDLRHFIKEVEGTIVINPERLTKGQTGGSYARVIIDEVPENNSGSVADFCFGEIVKI